MVTHITNNRKSEAKGLTISEASKFLKEIYSAELISPELHLSLLKERAINITNR